MLQAARKKLTGCGYSSCARKFRALCNDTDNVNLFSAITLFIRGKEQLIFSMYANIARDDRGLVAVCSADSYPDQGISTTIPVCVQRIFWKQFFLYARAHNISSKKQKKMCISCKFVIIIFLDLFTLAEMLFVLFPSVFCERQDFRAISISNSIHCQLLRVYPCQGQRVFP